MDPLSDVFLIPGYKCDGRWQVIRTLGEGAFGAVYECIDATGELEGCMALKVESIKVDVKLLKIEVSVARALEGSEYVCSMFACGRNDRFNFMLMSLLGPSLASLRRREKNHKFTFSTTVKTTLNCMKAVRDMHDRGWLHRDIKPSNFAIGPTPDVYHRIFIFDFGLCRKFCAKGADVRPARSAVGFRGTMRYCSLNAHARVELGRHDDLLSLEYMMVEMVRGQLPWRDCATDTETVLVKKDYDNKLCIKLPKRLQEAHNYFSSLKYENLPNYAMWEEVLMEIIYTMGYHTDQLDWQKKKDLKTKTPPNVTPAATDIRLPGDVDAEQAPELPATQYREIPPQQA